MNARLMQRKLHARKMAHRKNLWRRAKNVVKMVKPTGQVAQRIMQMRKASRDWVMEKTRGWALLKDAATSIMDKLDKEHAMVMCHFLTKKGQHAAAQVLKQQNRSGEDTYNSARIARVFRKLYVFLESVEKIRMIQEEELVKGIEDKLNPDTRNFTLAAMAIYSDRKVSRETSRVLENAYFWHLLPEGAEETRWRYGVLLSLFGSLRAIVHDESITALGSKMHERALRDAARRVLQQAENEDLLEPHMLDDDPLWDDLSDDEDDHLMHQMNADMAQRILGSQAVMLELPQMMQLSDEDEAGLSFVLSSHRIDDMQNTSSLFADSPMGSPLGLGRGNALGDHEESDLHHHNKLPFMTRMLILAGAAVVSGSRAVLTASKTMRYGEPTSPQPKKKKKPKKAVKMRRYV